MVVKDLDQRIFHQKLSEGYRALVVDEVSRPRETVEFTQDEHIILCPPKGSGKECITLFSLDSYQPALIGGSNG